MAAQSSAETAVRAQFTQETAMTPQETLDALDEAGRLLAPILQAEAEDRGACTGPDVPILTVGMDGKFTFSAWTGKLGEPHKVTGVGDSVSAAFVRFLAARSDKRAELYQAEAEAAAFAEWKAQRQQVVA